MEGFYVYVLRCADGSFYVGHTDNLEKRIADHCDGDGCIYTARRRPVELIFSENFQTRDEAFVVERKIKGWSRKKKEALAAKKLNQLPALSKKKF